MGRGVSPRNCITSASGGGRSPQHVPLNHFGMASPLRLMHPRKGLASPRVDTYFCVRTFWPRPRVTVPNVAPGFRLPAALLEGMASRVPRTFVFQTLASASGIGAQCRTRVRGHNLMSGGGGGMGGQLQGGALP